MLTFVRESRGHGVLTYGDTCNTFSVNVTNGCDSRDEDEEEEDETVVATAGIVRRMLAGERGLTATYSNYIYGDGADDSWFSLSVDAFCLSGGLCGPMFGGGVSIAVSYSENKAAVDAFLTFMVEKGAGERA